MDLVCHSIAHPVTALGPGRRVALWVAGCPFRCPGCITPELLEARGGKAVSVDRLATRMLRLDPRLDGITLSGGEPFAQAGALAALLERVLASRPHWSVIAFSGFRLARLRRMGDEAACLLERIDMLIDGPYVRERPSIHPLAGSGNQEVHYLTARGAALRHAVDSLAGEQANLALGTDGGVMLVGVIGPERRRAYHRALALGAAPPPPRDTDVKRAAGEKSTTDATVTSTTSHTDLKIDALRGSYE